MDTFVANKDIALTIDLIVDGNFVKPDDGSVVKYSVFGDDYSPMRDYTDVEVPDPLHTSITVVIPSGANTISSFLEFRTILLDFVSSGIARTVKKQYRLSELPAYTTSKDDVRLVFGLNNSDLPDDLIDIDSQYFQLVLKYPTILSWFKSGGLNSFKANRILALTTALGFASGLRMLAVATESDGTSKMSRFDKAADFDEMIEAAKSELGELTDELTDEDSTGSAISYFNVVTTEDIFTGE